MPLPLPLKPPMSTVSDESGVRGMNVWAVRTVWARRLDSVRVMLELGQDY